MGTLILQDDTPKPLLQFTYPLVTTNGLIFFAKLRRADERQVPRRLPNRLCCTPSVLARKFQPDGGAEEKALTKEKKSIQS